MTTYGLRKLERTLEEQDVDYNIIISIVETALSYNHLKIVEKFERAVQKIPIASLRLPV